MPDIFADRPEFPDNRREQYLEKPLPSSEESERVILGQILLHPEAIHDVSPYLQPEMFYSPLNRRIYAAMLRIAYGDLTVKTIDPIKIGEVLKMEGSLDAIGGISVITNLTLGIPYTANLDEYISTVKGKSMMRDRIRTCNSIVSDLLAEDDSADRLLQITETKFHDHVEQSGRAIHSNVSTAEEAITSFNSKISKWKEGKSTSLPSPFPLVNRRLNERGFALGDMSIIAARPSDGKTTLGVQIAEFIARHYAPSLIVTLEMSKEDIIQKIIAGEARVPNYRINEDLFKSTRLEDQQMVARIAEAEKRIGGYPLYIDEDSQTLTSIVSTMNEYATKKGCLFFFVDYGQMIRNDISKKGLQTRDRELGEIADHLKWFAKKQTKTKPKCHVQLAVQLKRLKAAPTIDDLRESGSFEQVADLVLAPWGDKPTEEVVMREMKLLCLKQRKGRMGWQLPFTLHGDWQRFYDKQNMDDDQAAVTGSLAFGPDVEF